MHSRLRTHAESVAFFGGGSREKDVSPDFNKNRYLQMTAPPNGFFCNLDSFSGKCDGERCTWTSLLPTMSLSFY